MPLFPICYLLRCVFLWRRRRRNPEATSSATINYILALFSSPDNHSGSIATFRIFSFFPPLLNTAIEPAAPSWFRNVKVDNSRNVAHVLPSPARRFGCSSNGCTSSDHDDLFWDDGCVLLTAAILHHFGVFICTWDWSCESLKHLKASLQLHVIKMFLSVSVTLYFF